MAEGTSEETQPPQTKKTEEVVKRKETTIATVSDDNDYPPPKRPHPLRLICQVISIILLLLGVTALVLYLIYRPHKPRFSVVGVALYDLNTTFLPFLTTTMQFTILAKNPNSRLSVYYDRLSVHVAYRNQEITPRVTLPPLILGKGSTVLMSPVVGGEAVPVAPEVADGLLREEAIGVVGLRVVVMGRLRWKAGPMRTGHYGLYVRCDVVMGLKNGFVGHVPLLAPTSCNVDV